MNRIVNQNKYVYPSNVENSETGQLDQTFWWESSQRMSYTRI